MIPFARAPGASVGETLNGDVSRRYIRWRAHEVPWRPGAVCGSKVKCPRRTVQHEHFWGGGRSRSVLPVDVYGAYAPLGAV